MSNPALDYGPASASCPTKAAAHRPLIKSADFRAMAEPLNNLIVRYPGAALASAFLVGVAIAWWIKRR